MSYPYLLYIYTLCQFTNNQSGLLVGFTLSMYVPFSTPNKGHWLGPLTTVPTWWERGQWEYVQMKLELASPIFPCSGLQAICLFHFLLTKHCEGTRKYDRGVLLWSSEVRSRVRSLGKSSVCVGRFSILTCRHTFLPCRQQKCDNKWCDNWPMILGKKRTKTKLAHTVPWKAQFDACDTMLVIVSIPPKFTGSHTFLFL